MDPKDYLSVDPDIPGQKVVLLSFLPPKEASNLEFRRPIKECMHEAVDEYVDRWCKEVENVLSEGGDLGQVLRRHAVETLAPVMIERERNWENSVKKGLLGGVKVRGVYDDDKESLEQADERCKQLSKMDKQFHIFRGQVGYWLPFNQPVSTVDKTEYSDEKLNDVMKSYLKNKISAEVFERQRQEKMKEDALQKSLGVDEEAGDRQAEVKELTFTHA